MDEPLVVCFHCNYFEWNVTLVNVPNLSCVNVFSVLIDIVPQMLSIELNLYWTRYIPLSKRTLQLTIFINAVNVHFLAIQSSVPGNSCLNGAMINECQNCHYKVTQSPSPQGQTLQLLLDNSASKPAILRVWEGWAVWWGYKSATGQIKMWLGQCKGCVHLLTLLLALICSEIYYSANNPSPNGESEQGKARKLRLSK